MLQIFLLATPRAALASCRAADTDVNTSSKMRALRLNLSELFKIRGVIMPKDGETLEDRLTRASQIRTLMDGCVLPDLHSFCWC